MSSSPSPPRSVMVDRRWLGGSRCSVPQSLMSLYARVAQNDVSCREIRLCHKVLGRQNYQELIIHMAKLLEVNTTVSLFFLHQTEIATEAALAIGNMIRSNKNIQTLSFHRIDATYLATVLGMSLSENTHVTSLTLFANTFASFQAFQPLTFCLERAQSRLTELSLERCHLNDEFLASLWQALSTNSVLNKLDLRDMRLTESDVIQLCQALESNVAQCQIHTLLLDKNWMQDDGCASVATWMMARRPHHQSPLEELSLAYNHIAKEGILAFAHALVNIQHNNEDDDETDSHTMKNSTPVPVLSSLNLSGNALTTEDVVNLIHALTVTPPPPSTDGVLLPPNPGFVVSKLSLEDCNLDDDAMLHVAQSLPSLDLVSLNVSGHVVSKTIGQVFLQALQSTTACTSLLDLQVDLADDDQKTQVDFYVRLNRGGRHLLRLSHYEQPQSTSGDDERIEVQAVAEHTSERRRHPSSVKSMPCSLWPFVLARLSKTQVLDEICKDGNLSGGSSSRCCQADVMYYMLREKIELVQPPLQVSLETMDEATDGEGASMNSTRKRKRNG